MQLPLSELSNHLRSAQSVLITGPQHPSLDTVSTAVAWAIFLSQQNKQVEVAFDMPPQAYDFWPEYIKIKPSLSEASKLKIILDLTRTKVKQLSYNVIGNELHVEVLPDSGQFKPEHVKINHQDYKFDLVIILGALNLSALGNIYWENKALFFERPIINIDRSVLNENYGQLNIVESNSTSLAEISYHILQKHLNADIATCLLAGLISATNSFQSPLVTPQILELASQLIIKGADRAKIVESLYRTKNIETLKNWGKILSRLYQSGNVVVSHLLYNEEQNMPQDFQEMVNDLILVTPHTQAVVILRQIELKQTEAWIYTAENINAINLVQDLPATGHRRFVRLLVEKDWEETRDLLIPKIQSQLDMINAS